MLKRRIATLAAVAVVAAVGSLAAPAVASASASPQAPQLKSIEYATGYGSTVSEAEADAYDLLQSEFFGCGAPALVASGDAGGGTLWAEIKAFCNDN